MTTLHHEREPQTGTSPRLQLLTQWVGADLFPLWDVGGCCAAAASVSSECICVRRIKFYVQFTVAGRSGRKTSSCGPRGGGQTTGPRSSLFTALACDGGAAASLPITERRSDGDAAGGESNSLSPSLWTLFTPREVTRPRQSTGCARAHTRVILFSVCRSSH